MAISQFTLADKGPATEPAVAFRPGALAVLGKDIYVNVVMRKKVPGKLNYLDMMGS